MNNTETSETSNAIVQKPTIQTALRDRAKESPVFNAMVHAFALRRRTRRQVTINNLYWTMYNEGFKYTKDDYQKELDFLAGLGLGSLDKKQDGTILALKNISATLQSIGFTALNKKQNLKRAFFKELTQAKSNKPAKLTSLDSPNIPYKAKVSFEINGKRVGLDLEPNVSPSELFAILFELNSKSEESRNQ